MSTRDPWRRGMLFLCFFAFILTPVMSFAQDSIVIKGIVLNMSQEPVSNVSIGVEGSSEFPAITDQAGAFSLKVSSPNIWLNVQPSDLYKSRRIFFNGQVEMKIFLTYEGYASGDDPVILFTRNRLKRNLVSAFSTVDVNEINESFSMSVDQYLQDRIPGLHVVNRSLNPVAGAFTALRGVNSLNGSNEPLYIVDGIQLNSLGYFGSNIDGLSFNPLMAVNMMDISKISFLKDPSLTAVYGTRGSNGVVLINTLDPSATQTVIELDLRTGFTRTPDRLIPQLNADQNRSLISEILFSSNNYEEEIKELFPNLFLQKDDERYIDYQHNTFWQDKIFRESIYTNVNLQVKGGDEIARYGLSFGFQDGEGPISETGYQGYNLRFVSKLNVFTWLNMKANVALNYHSAKMKESAIAEQTSPIRTALAKSPMLNPYEYDSEGRELISIAPVDELGVSNPQAVIDLFSGVYNNFNFISSFGIEATVSNNLSFLSDFGLNYNMMEEQVFLPNTGMELYYNTEAINVSKIGINSLSSFENNTFMEYSWDNSDHFISSYSGFNTIINTFEYDMALTKNSSPNDQYRNLQDGTSNLREIGGLNRKWNWLTIYENVNYRYRDKYLVSTSISLNGSSRIGPDSPNTLKINTVPFGFFYGLALGWRISEEGFLQDKYWLEELKLRFSYGKTGNDDIGESNASPYYQMGRYRETAGLYPAQIPNSELTYETVSQLNAGLDLSVFGNRLSTSIDVYTSRTDDLLIYTPVESYLGYSFRPINGGVVSNRGVDIGFFFRVFDFANLKWDVSGSLSLVKNEVLEVEGGSIVRQIQGAEIINMPGFKANSFYGYVFDGVYSTSSEAAEANLLNDKFLPYQAGDAKFRDLSGPEGVPDGIINQYDKTVIGSSLPDQFGGITNRLTYMNWSISAHIQFVRGNEVFNYVRYLNERMSDLDNQSINTLNRWQYEGHETEVPRALWNDPMGNSAFSTRWIEDGSFVRLKNVTLAYTLGTKFLAFRNAEVYVSAVNLFTQSKYLGYDPEFGYSRSHINQGVDYGLAPHTKQFLAGIKLGF